ncbi:MULTISPECIES: hypothetical protein [Nocardiaceae]|uniref:Uncharacterized protein n=1 Tax=Rhodococcoides corynebacterioides TaxID=53972 RepID=A0ABS2KYK8_9NOCA|nr:MULTISPECIES: hypothetical protein [Rhodococcus]MBM7417028.1 hypothetical protein [Rhodococcus corynebacterioides]MBP1115281.1 hypothetical protein [Rhodococcus sp. PvP016]
MSTVLLQERYERLVTDRRSAIARDAPPDDVVSVSNECTRVRRELDRRAGRSVAG